MKSKAKSKIIILITIGILFTFSPIINDNFNSYAGISENSTDYSADFNVDNKNLKISAVSGKIHVDNNWTAAKVAGICTGNGIYSDPYVIEDLVIDGGGSGSCILIGNSSVYFRIENCTFYNSGPSYPNAGIQLSNVNNSMIIRNNCSLNYYGIDLWECNDNTISGNTVNYNNYYGINLYFSRYNTVSGNTANNNGIGIFIFYSHDNTVSGNTVNYNNYYGIFLVDSNDNTVSGNTANNNRGYGILISLSDNNTISGNTANNNDGGGILISFSNGNTVSGNTVNYNDLEGIKLLRSDNNNITGNIVILNGDVGMQVNSSNANIIYLNCFVNNVNAYCNSKYNYWDNGVKGNYWSDYMGLDRDGDGIGDTPYWITGPAGRADNYPLMKCPIFVQDPIGLIILISVFSGGAVIGVATLLLIRLKRKRIE